MKALASAGNAGPRRVSGPFCPAAQVSVEGYVDSTIIGGSTLSLRRAEAVKAALVKAGVKAGRIQTQGFGDSYPAASNDTAQGRALNNRVELSGGSA